MNKIDREIFIESLKPNIDYEGEYIKEIQKELEKRGINKTNIEKLYKNLSKIQKDKLLDLYKKEIRGLELRLSNYKNKILILKNST